MGTTTISSTASSPLDARSTSPLNVESIISTRQRRHNAGNRLRQLLNNAEEPLDFEDEEGHNIFQEVEGDDEFDLNASESEDELDDDDAEDSKSNENAIDDNKPKRLRTSNRTSKRRAAPEPSPQSPKRQKIGSENDDDDNHSRVDDDMFSDSSESDSSSNDDDSAGEKEYQKQRQAEARRAVKKKRDNFMPTSVLKAQQRRARIDKAVKIQKEDVRSDEDVAAAELERQRLAKREKLRIAADHFMSENRRRSTRKAAVKNAEGVLKRLKESEVRRAKMATPTVKIVHKITQEERLKEAVITEKKNVESLNTFYQQEEDRRKLRRAALLAKRAPMTSFIRYVSKTTYFEPSPIQPLIQEIPVESQKSLVKRDSKRKKETKQKPSTSSVIQDVENHDNDDTDKLQLSNPDNFIRDQPQHHSSHSDIHDSLSGSNSSQIPEHGSDVNVSMNIPVTAVTHDHLPSAIDSHLTHNSVDMMDSIPIDPTIHDTSVHQTPGLPVSSVTDHGHNPHPSPPSHMVMDPTSGNPYDTLSPVTMSFSHHEDDYRRSTSVEQLEADYINFHVAEESSEIVDVGILPERRETEGSVDLNLVKGEHESHHIHSDDIGIQIATTSAVLSSSVASVLGSQSPSAFPMSDMIISDVDEPKSDNLQDHKSNLVVSDHLSAEQESIIIPANYSSTIIPSTTSHESPTIDDVKTLQSPQIIPSEPTDIAHVSSPTSMDIMKSHYGQSIAEENLLNSQTPILASTETTGAEPQPALLSESVDTFQMTKLDDASEVLDDPPSRVVQGPRECRAVTTISLMEFPESFHYTTPDIQKVLFGPQSLEIPVVPPERSNDLSGSMAGSSSGYGGRKKRNDKVGDTGKNAKDSEGAWANHKEQDSARGKLANSSGSKAGTAKAGSSASLASLTSNPLFSRGFGMKVGSTGLSVSGTSVGPLGTGVIGSGGGGPSGLSAAAANAAAAAAAAAAANGGLYGGSASARAKSAAALAALQQAPKCVITGKPCKFVDPKSGLPYSSMEAFQMIRQVVNFDVPWNQDFGIFMGPLGKEARHAKGVPPGFANPI